MGLAAIAILILITAAVILVVVRLVNANDRSFRTAFVVSILFVAAKLLFYSFIVSGLISNIIHVIVLILLVRHFYRDKWLSVCIVLTILAIIFSKYY